MPPAARIGDMHVCPMFNVLVPHVGGPVAMGCGNVFIGGMPAVRVNDLTTCAGPPDGVAMGSQTVLIAGMPAARIGDITMHGGVVTVGSPQVMIG